MVSKPQIRASLSGIYRDALSELLRSRCQVVAAGEAAEVTIRECRGRQGVAIQGMASAVPPVLDALRPALLDARVSRPRRQSGRDDAPAWAAGLDRLLSEYVVVLGSASRLALDEIRARVVPTLPGHHHLSILNEAKVLAAERSLGSATAEGRQEVALELKRELLASHYPVDGTVHCFHLKPRRETIRFTGSVIRFDPERLVLRRAFKGGGSYDGLNVPKQEGDWGTLEIDTTRWHSRRSYFRRDGTHLGDILNVNTPAEFYPDGVRYLDLEVDIVVPPEGPARLVDEDHLERGVRAGAIPRALAERAREEAKLLLAGLKKEKRPQAVSVRS